MSKCKSILCKSIFYLFLFICLVEAVYIIVMSLNIARNEASKIRSNEKVVEKAHENLGSGNFILISKTKPDIYDGNVTHGNITQCIILDKNTKVEYKILITNEGEISVEPLHSADEKTNLYK